MTTYTNIFDEPRYIHLMMFGSQKEASEEFHPETLSSEVSLNRIAVFIPQRSAHSRLPRSPLAKALL